MKLLITKEDLETPLSELNTPDLPVLDSEMKTVEMVDVFLNSPFLGYPVLKDEKFQGLITKGIFVLRFSEEIIFKKEDQVLGDIIDQKAPTLYEGATVFDALKLMYLRNAPILPILDSETGNYKYSVSYLDVFKWIVGKVEDYLDRVEFVDNWQHVDLNIIERNFKFIKKGELHDDFFKESLKSVVVRKQYNLSEDFLFKDFVESQKNKKSFWAGPITRHETKITGLVSANDILHWLKDMNFLNCEKESLGSIGDSSYSMFMKKHSFELALKHMLVKNTKYLMIVDEDKYPIQMLSIFDILNYITKTVFLDNRSISHPKQVA